MNPQDFNMLVESIHEAGNIRSGAQPAARATIIQSPDIPSDISARYVLPEFTDLHCAEPSDDTDSPSD